MKPKRIQRKRTKGWKMPPNTVYVGRPSKFGNYNETLEMYEDLTKYFTQAFKDIIKRDLKGKNLCCWCPLDKPCHADILLRIAND